MVTEKPVRTTVLLLVSASICACSGVNPVSRPTCLPAPPAEGFAQGVGQAATYKLARADALGGICQSIRAEVSSLVQVGKSAMYRTGSGKSDTAVFQEIAQVVDRLRANCYFEDLPIREVLRQDLGGTVCVALELSTRDYYEFLGGRRCEVRVKGRGTEVTGHALGSVIMDDLRSRGFLPVTEGDTDTRYLADVVLTLALRETGVSGLWIAKGRLEYSILERETNEVIRNTGPLEVTYRGFDKQQIADKAEEEAARLLSGLLGETR